jgi:hypothetical protein
VCCLGKIRDKELFKVSFTSQRLFCSSCVIIN